MTLQTLRQPPKKTPLNKIGENIRCLQYICKIHIRDLFVFSGSSGGSSMTDAVWGGTGSLGTLSLMDALDSGHRISA